MAGHGPSINGDGSYRSENSETGAVEILTYNQVLSVLKRPGTSAANMLMSISSAAARIRQGGLHYRDQLSAVLRDQIDFRKALCVGIDQLEATGVRVNGANLDRREHRRFIRDIASQLYRTRPINVVIRGGSSKLVAIMPRGRTLVRYRARYVESGYDEMALVDQAWLRGNRISRISTRMHDLMTLATEQSYLDLKKPTVASAYKRLKTLLQLENATRIANGSEPLKLVSYGTLRDHIEKNGSTALATARDGERAVANNRSRGVTDTRALMIGELVEIDECKLSLITVAKEKGWWERLCEEDQAALEEIEEIIRTRLWLVLMVDVASRMPLAWVLTDAPCAEATLELLRMATRDKTREKIIYGCERDPMPPIGIGSVKGDNGTGIRNAVVKAATLGVAAQSIDVRTHRGGDKPYIERLFGSLETRLISLIHGYTGRKAGALPGYDAIKNGVLDCEEFYGLITRYLVDEYPFERHYGVTMMGRRPIKVAQEINRDYGAITVPADHDRRIQLGWRKECTITDEGVKAFGLPYSSPELQILRDHIAGKVAVFLDPDNISHATILIEGHPEPVLADLSWTAMKNLTLPEFLRIAEEARAEDPEVAAEFEALRARVRKERFDQLYFIATEHELARSFMTIAEAQKKAEIVMSGVYSPRHEPVLGTTPRGSVAREGAVAGVRKIGAGFQPAIDGRTDGTAATQQLDKPNTKGKLS
ncbi:MAG: hypothetical protein ACRECW_20585 [Phyllobacterium sp.]